MPRARFALFLVAALAAWLPNMHRWHDVNAGDRRRLVTALVDRQLTAGAGDVAPMRAQNPEWDFMRRTFAALALANLALEAPAAEQARLLAALDDLVDGTIRDDERFGAGRFLLPYAQRAPFEDPETTSLFVDGELVMMMAARELVAPRPALHGLLHERAARIERTMRRSPTLSAESYPDECWTFCNTTALAGLVMLDRALGTDHHALAQAWVATAREKLVDPGTGLLVSSYTRDGRVLDGPEGSSIWMSAHNLLVIDAPFAREQYARARAALRGSALGYAWAREWPVGTPPRPDVDSGPIAPFVEASAGASGLALLGASAFGDEEYLAGLLASLELTGFREGDRYRTSNAVGDAVILYALTSGPLWRKVRS